MEGLDFISTAGLIAAAAALAVLAVVVLLKLANIVGLRRPTQRIELRPFLFLQDNTGYDGEACARLLEMEFEHEEGQPAGKTPDDASGASGRGRTRTSTADSTGAGSQLKLNAKVAGASIPMDFLWTWIRRAVDGRVHRYDFVVLRDDDGRLEIEGARGDHRYFGVSSDYEKSDNMRTAIESIAEDIRASYWDQSPALLSNYVSQGQFAKARELIQKWPTQLESRLPETLYFSGENAKALRRFDAPGAVVDDIDYVGCLIELRKFSRAIERLSAIDDGPTAHRLRFLRGEAYRGMRDLQSAMQSYAAATAAARDVLKSDPENTDALWTIVDVSIAASEVLYDFGTVEEREEQLELAVTTCETLERYDHSVTQIRVKAFMLRDLERTDEAIQEFHYCESICEDQRASDPSNIFHRSAHAWVLAGIASCSWELLRNLVQSEFKLVGADLDGPFGAVERLAQYIGEIPENERNRGLANALDGKWHPDVDIVLPPKFNSMLGPILKDRDFLTMLVMELVRQQAAELDARMAFEDLQMRQSAVHRADGHYGLAWMLMNTGGNDWEAHRHFSTAFSSDLSLKERAYWDCDLVDLRAVEFDGVALEDTPFE